MVKQDEIEFAKIILKNEGRVQDNMWLDLTKRHYYILEKWSGKGYWNYGITLRSGWLEPEGFEYLKKITTHNDTKRRKEII